MRTLHLIGDDDMYTNLAFLLSEQCMHMIKLAVFEGSKKSVFKDRLELSGSLLEQLEEAFDYIDRYVVLLKYSQITFARYFPILNINNAISPQG